MENRVYLHVCFQIEADSITSFVDFAFDFDKFPDREKLIERLKVRMFMYNIKKAIVISYTKMTKEEFELWDD